MHNHTWGDKRVIKKFFLLPKKVDGKWYFCRNYYVEQLYALCYTSVSRDQIEFEDMYYWDWVDKKLMLDSPEDLK